MLQVGTRTGALAPTRPPAKAARPLRDTGPFPSSPASSMAAAAAAFPLLKRQRASDGDKRAALLTPECSPLKGPESPSE